MRVAGGRPRGGCLAPLRGASGLRRCPSPGPLSTCCGRGRAGVGAGHCLLGLHALRGAACRRCGGGPSPGRWPSTVARGVWCQALSLPRPPVIWGGQPGFRDPRVSRAGFMWAWAPSTRPKACALASHCCALWAWQEDVPGAGTFCRCEGRLDSGFLPPTAAHVQWARVCGCVGRALFPPLACPVGGCGLRGWLGAVLGGAAFYRYGGRPVSGAVPPPVARHLGGRAARVPRPVCPGCGWSGFGGPAPALQCAPLRAVVARRGGAGRASLGGVDSTVVRGVWCQAPSLPRSPVLWRAGSQGSAIRVSRARLVWAWGPSTGPIACALASRHCALWGWRKDIPGGGAFRRCEGRLGSGALPSLAARPLGGLSGSATTCCGRSGAGEGAQHCPLGLQTLWEAAYRGAGGEPSPGGLTFHGCKGRLVSGAVPPPAAHPLGRAAGVPRPVCPVCGWCGRG